MDGRESETVEIVYLICNGGGINSPHRSAIEIHNGQRRIDLPPAGFYVCDACREACRRRRYQQMVQQAEVKHDSNAMLDRICKGLSDLFRN